MAHHCNIEIMIGLIAALLVLVLYLIAEIRISKIKKYNEFTRGVKGVNVEGELLIKTGEELERYSCRYE